MTSRKILINNLTASFIIFAIVSILILTGTLSTIHFLSFLTGFSLSLLYSSIGYVILLKMKNQPFNKFFGLLIGGMLLRLFLMLMLVFLVLYFLELNTFSFIFSFLFFYIIFLISEVFYLKSVKI